MCSNGQTLKILILSFLLFSNLVFADDEGGWIALPGQIEEDQKIEVKEDGESHITSKSESYLGNEVNGQSSYLKPEDNSAAEALVPGINNSNITTPSYKSVNSYKTVSNNEIIDGIQDKWTSGFGFAYFKDTYQYDDRNGIFDATFKDGVDNSTYGTFMFQFKQKIGSIFFTKVNMGFGYSRGKGFFIPDGAELTTPEASSTEVKLYSVPLELGLGVKGNFSRYLNLALSGGGGVMGLWQHRDDRKQDADDKNIRQVGYGYFGQASLGLSLSSMSSQLGVDLLSDFQVTNFNLEFITRIQNYSNFKNTDVVISGTSYGIGLSFEYL